MSDFNLSALTRTTLRGSRQADPADVAAEVYAAIPPEQYGAALAIALRAYVQNIASRTRYHAEVAPNENIPAGDQPGRGTQGQDVSGGEPYSRAAGMREAWRQLLESRVGLSANTRQWRFIGDCTADNLKLIAEIKLQTADRNIARAQHFLKLRELVMNHSVTTVRELPDDVLAPVLSAMVD